MGNDKTTVYCDGGSRGNPGPAASAFAIVFNGKQIHKESSYLGKSTNNIAEYKSVIMALEWLVKNDEYSKNVLFVVDSQLVYKQLVGEYKIKNEKLKELVIKIKSLEKNINSKIKFSWSPRSKNKIADRLVNKELDRVA
jgi:ribonuclease HI